jgi:hypothetical protein
MADTHNVNKYSVNSRLNAHDAQLLALDKAIKSVVLSPGPQGKQGQTGASGADGRNGNPGRDGRDGKDSCVPGPQGPRGDITIVGDTELAAAVAQLRAEKARAQAAFLIAIDENSKRPHSGLKRVLTAILDTLKRDAGL